MSYQSKQARHRGSSGVSIKGQDIDPRMSSSIHKRRDLCFLQATLYSVCHLFDVPSPNLRRLLFSVCASLFVSSLATYPSQGDRIPYVYVVDIGGNTPPEDEPQ